MIAVAEPASLRRSSPAPRPMADGDLDGIVALHLRVFGPPRHGAADLRALLGDIFCRHPWRDDRLRSLVVEEGGEIVGCLGVMPRPMRFEGRPLLAAVAHNGMVDPAHRSNLTALALVWEFLRGPQQLSLTPGNDAARRLWGTLGGRPIALYSLLATLVLRPAGYLGALARTRVPAWLAGASRPACAIADAVASRWPGSPFRAPSSELDASELDSATLGVCLELAARRRTLGPHYDPAALDWMLGLLTRPTGPPLRRVVLRRRGEIAGWYLYHPRPHGIAELLHIGALGGAASAVVDHLMLDALGHGAAAIRGPLEPTLWPAFSERPCLLHRGRGAPWLVAHSRDERVLGALDRGEALLTPLETEFWA